MKRISKKEFEEIGEKHSNVDNTLPIQQKIIEKHSDVVNILPIKQKTIEKHSDVDNILPIQQRIIDVLEKKGDMSRDEICEEFGFKKKAIVQIQYYPNKTQCKIKYISKMERYNKRTTIYDNLSKLERKGRIERFDVNNGKRGRSITMWKFIQSLNSKN